MGWAVIKSLLPCYGALGCVSLPAWGSALGAPLRALHTSQKVKQSVQRCSCPFVVSEQDVFAVPHGCLALLTWKKDCRVSMGSLECPNLIEERRTNKEWFSLLFSPMPGRGGVYWEKWSFQNVEAVSYRTGDRRNPRNIHEICVPLKAEPWSMACPQGTVRLLLYLYAPWAACGGTVQT